MSKKHIKPSLNIEGGTGGSHTALNFGLKQPYTAKDNSKHNDQSHPVEIISLPLSLKCGNLKSLNQSHLQDMSGDSLDLSKIFNGMGSATPIEGQTPHDITENNILNVTPPFQNPHLPAK